MGAPDIKVPFPITRRSHQLGVHHGFPTSQPGISFVPLVHHPLTAEPDIPDWTIDHERKGTVAIIEGHIRESCRLVLATGNDSICPIHLWDQVSSGQ